GPRLRILATSRQPLGLTGETVWRVPSLSVPEEGRRVVGSSGRWDPDLPVAPRPNHSTALLQSEAGQLFLPRAAALPPGLTLTGENAAAVGQVCRRLDGIPLALELAAARLNLLTVEQLARRLDDRFRLLTGGSRTAPTRQQTLRATMEWSLALLSEAERVLLR